METQMMKKLIEKTYRKKILNLEACNDLTLICNKSDVTMLADIFETFIATCYKKR